jgi:hypothetical protein
LPRERRCCCSVAGHRYDRCCLGGFGCNRWSIYGAKKSLNRAGDRETHTIRLLPNRPRLGNYAKFALSFDKLPKLQTSNVKSLDTSFCDFLANYKNANPKCKTIGDTLSYFLSIFNDLCIHLKIWCDRESWIFRQGLNKKRGVLYNSTIIVYSYLLLILTIVESTSRPLKHPDSNRSHRLAKPPHSHWVGTTHVIDSCHPDIPNGRWFAHPSSPIGSRQRQGWRWRKLQPKLGP